MKAREIMERLFAFAMDWADFSNTCDTCKAGDPEREVKRVAVCMFPTPDVIKDAKAWGAELLIVHEPAYYNHFDNHSDDKIEVEKHRLIEGSGITVWRYHDHPHYTFPDQIAVGQLRQFGLKGEIEYTHSFDLVRVHLDEPITPRALAKDIEKKCGIRHLRVCGAADVPCSVISGMFGAPGGAIFDELKSDKCEMLLVGETCEWQVAEYARDAAQLGYKKALIIMGHVGSERDGMVYIADLLKETIPELEVRYIECGEVYTYTD